ncbi:hypothetical protein Dip510_001929 [Elusimicrobium posterum]|uniref:hypothetical protein n=1 Tax=Elusimicrobium posterum TaxID=3116653 RepID=UPI003C70D109
MNGHVAYGASRGGGFNPAPSGINLNNIILLVTALVSFSVWLAATISTPKKLERIEARLNAAENNYSAISVKIEGTAQDVRDIKKLLMGGK